MLSWSGNCSLIYEVLQAIMQEIHHLELGGGGVRGYEYRKTEQNYV